MSHCDDSGWKCSGSVLDKIVFDILMPAGGGVIKESRNSFPEISFGAEQNALVETFC